MGLWLVLFPIIFWLICFSVANQTVIGIKNGHFYFENAKLHKNEASVKDIVTSFGYPMQTHTVITTDGYNLTLHRIPYGKSGQRNGKVAYLQHGILCSSADWVILGPGKALAFLLADEGYDVWLGNARGNTESRKHVVLDPDKDSKFWNFSWHDIGVIDVPKMIDYVLEITKVDGVYYAGHSQGTTVFYVMTSSLPQYNNKIKAQVSLAPIGYMNHMTSPLLHILSFWRKPLKLLLDIIGVNEFLPSSDFLKNVVAGMMCSKDSLTQILCSNSLFAICGFSRTEMNTTLLPIMMHYTPAGSSTKQLLHYGQLISSGKFRQYDYGLLGNLKQYGTAWPKEYELSKITAPVYLLYSKNDWLSAEQDVVRIGKELGNCKAKLLLSDYSFNHLDYMYGINAPSIVYNKIISIFSRH